MRLRNPAHRTSAAAGLAAGGVLLGHGLAYRLVSPDVAARSRLLASTGHGYLPAANTVALVAVSLTLGAIFLGRLTRPWATPGWRTLGGRIAVLQVGAFLVMELFERVGSGAPLAGLLRGGLLPAGIAAQLLVAILVTMIVRLVLRMSEAAAAILGRAPRLGGASGPAPARPALAAPPHPDPLPAFGRGPPPSR